MSVSITTILDWFKTGLKPTQAQFWDAWQSFWHKEEMIPQASIADLPSSLNLKADKNGTLSFKGEIPNAANLNDYITTGIFHQGANLHAVAGANYPVPLAGQLEVVANPDFIYQKYHVYGDYNDMYYRTYYSPIGWSDWKKVNDMMKANLPSGANFNNYIQTGFYIQTSDPYAATGINYPTPHAGALEVIGHPDFIYQKYHVYGPHNTIYFRTFFSATGWYPWKRIVDESELLTTFMRRGAVVNQNANTDFENTTGFWNYEGANGSPSNFYVNAEYGNFAVIGNGTFNTQIQYINNGDMAFRTKFYTHDWASRNWRRVWDSYNLTAANQLNTDELLHKTGDEIKTGNIIIDGNDRGYYLGNMGNNASIIYNNNGNLDITPRAGYNTIITEGKVGIGKQNPSSKLSIDGDLFVDANNTSDFRVAAFGNNAYDGTMGNGENRLYFQWADHDAAYIGAYKNTYNTSGLAFAIQYGFGNVIEKMRLNPFGQFLIGTTTENATGSLLQINGRASGEPAINDNEFVTKSQIEGLSSIMSTEVEISLSTIGGFDYHEEYLYFEGAAIGDFVDMVIPQSFNTPHLDIRCLCVDENKIQVRFTCLSQNYFPDTTGIFKFRIIK